MSIDDPVALGDALRLLRHRGQRMQRVVAGMAGLSPAMLSSYETGRELPSLRSLKVLLDALRCDLHDLQDALDQVAKIAEASQRRPIVTVEPVLSSDAERVFALLEEKLSGDDLLRLYAALDEEGDIVFELLRQRSEELVPEAFEAGIERQTLSE